MANMGFTKLWSFCACFATCAVFLLWFVSNRSANGERGNAQESAFFPQSSCNVHNFLDKECRETIAKMDIVSVAKLAQTDEFWPGSYQPHYYTAYQELFSNRFRPEKFTLIEFGVFKGNSLKFWKAIFPNAQIVGVDLAPKPAALEKYPEIHFYQGAQCNKTLLKQLCSKYSDIRVIIDDASHVAKETSCTFNATFPCMSDDSYYAVEDCYGFWHAGPGGSCDPRRALLQFKGLVDSINYGAMEFAREHYERSFWDVHVHDIHFYPNMFVIHKKKHEDGFPNKAKTKMCPG